MGWLDKLFGHRKYVVEVSPKEYISSADIEWDGESYVFRSEFTEPAGKGNDIDRINVRWEKTGRVMYNFNLAIGDTGLVWSFKDKPDVVECAFLAISIDDEIRYEDSVSISHVGWER